MSAKNCTRLYLPPRESLSYNYSTPVFDKVPKQDANDVLAKREPWTEPHPLQLSAKTIKYSKSRNRYQSERSMIYCLANIFNALEPL